LGIPHLPFQLRPGHQGCHGIDHEDVEGAAAHQGFGDLQGLLTRIRLGDEQLVGIDPDLPGIAHIQGVFRIDEGRQAVLPLGLGDDVEGQRCLAARFRTIDLDDPSPGHAAHSQGDVQAEGSRGNYRDIDLLRSPQLHDGPFAELPLDLTDGQIHSLVPVHIYPHRHPPSLIVEYYR